MKEKKRIKQIAVLMENLEYGGATTHLINLINSKKFKYAKFIIITNKNNKLQINLALNYGAKKELVSAFNIIKKNKQKITEKSISNNLFTNNIPDPEILIRTGNTHRLSNFLLWQIAYSEIFFIKKLWPDFNTNDFKQIINKFKNIKRNFGSV